MVSKCANGMIPLPAQTIIRKEGIIGAGKEMVK